MHGIGGNSIEAAQRALGYREVQVWAAYRRKHGSLNLAKHVERGFGLLSSIYVNSRRKKGTPPIPIHEFMPHEDEPEISLEEAMKQWK
jgi:hypothetical protein